MRKNMLPGTSEGSVNWPLAFENFLIIGIDWNCQKITVLKVDLLGPIYLGLIGISKPQAEKIEVKVSFTNNWNFWNIFMKIHPLLYQ